MERMLLEYLVNSLWQAPLLAAAAWMVLRAARPGSRVQHGAWVAALGLMVAMPLLTLRGAGAESVVDSAAPAQDGDAADWAVAPLDGAFATASTEDHSGHWAGELRLTPRATLGVVEIYLAALGIAMLRLLWSWRMARGMVAEARPAHLSGMECEEFAGCCDRMGVRQPRVMVSARTSSPLVVGVVRPVLLLPERFADATDGAREFEAVWWHELAHIRRRDYLANLALRIWSLPVAYHPATFAVERRVRQTREMVCDAMAAERMQSRVRYARSLLSLAERMQAVSGMGQLGAGMFDGGVLEERVIKLLEAKRTMSRRMRALRVACGVAMVVVAVGAAAVFHVTPTLAEAALAGSGLGVAAPSALPSAAVAPPKLAGITGTVQTSPRAGLAQIQLAQNGTSSGSARGASQAAMEGVQVLSDTGSVDFNGYLRRLHGDVQRNWERLIPAKAKAPGDAKGVVGIRLTVLPDGAIGSMKLETRSGDVDLDKAAWAALTSEGRFAPLPKEFHGPGLELRIGFFYNTPVANGGWQGVVRYPAAAAGTREVRYDGPSVPPEPQAADAGPAPRSPVRVSGGVMAADVMTQPNPVYPPIAKAAHVSGAVVLRARVSKTGAVENLTAVSGPEMLRSAAIDAVKQWTYKPYLLNGQPVEVDTTITVNFSFGGDSSAPDSAAPTDDASPLRVASGVMAGDVISRPDPVYPPDAKAAHVSGSVVLHAIISKTGMVDSLAVVSGPEMLRSSALDAVRQWTYKPFLLNGQPVEVETTITVNYTFGEARVMPGLDAVPPAGEAMLARLLSPSGISKPRTWLMAQAAVPVAPAQASPQASESTPSTAEQRAKLDLQMEAARQQIQEAAKKLNSPEFRQQIEQAQKQVAEAAAKIDSPEFRQQIEQAQKQVADAAAKFNSPEFRKQIQDAVAAQQKLNWPELQKQMDQVRKQMEAAQEQIRAAAKEQQGH